MDWSSYIFASLFWPMYLIALVVHLPWAGVPIILLVGCLFFWISRRIESLFLGYFTTTCFLLVTLCLGEAFFQFAEEIPQLGFLKFGFALCVVFALAKFATALTMGYNDMKAIKTVSFCCLISLGLWTFLVAGTQIIDTYIDRGFFIDEGLEIYITIFGLSSIVLIDGAILDWMLKECHDDNAALALSMNTVANGLLLISHLFLPFAY